MDQDMKARNHILKTTLIGAFWSAYSITSVNVAIPAIANEFSSSAAYTSWIITSTLLVTALFVLPIGKISDVYGRKKTLLAGSIIMTVTSLMCGLSQSINAMIIFRGLQGIGGAMMAATVISIVTAAFPPTERGKALGINIAFTYIGLSASPFISGIIVNYLNWRGIYFLSIPLGILLTFMVIKIDKEWKLKEKIKIDWVGAIIYGAGILCIVWGLTNFNKSTISKMIFIAGILIIIYFGYFEMKVKQPLLNVGTMKSNRVLIFSSLASLINYSSTYAISYMMSLYLQYIKGLDPQYAGIVLLVQPSMQALFSPVAGYASDKIEPQYVASAGMSIIAVSLFFVSRFDSETSFAFMLILLSLIGLGFALFSSPNTNSIMSSMDSKEYGVAAAILTTSRTVGQSFSMALTAMIISIYLGNSIISADTSGLFIKSFRTTFFIFSIFCFIGIWASMARGKRV
ncbi:MAG TPA: MFS transporter [Eubacteriaceae bacterium]|jgi:EmrB/QacA subfamily drug resistance transporter|nr:MFS transporter [Eubacteriaceae bacterium]